MVDIYRYGVERVNGGFEDIRHNSSVQGTNLIGSLYHYVVDFGADAVLAEAGGAATNETVEEVSFSVEVFDGDNDIKRAVPRSALEVVYGIVAQRGTMVIMQVVDDQIHFALENTASDWDGVGDFSIEELKVELAAIGEYEIVDGDGVEKVVNFGAIEVDRTPYVLDVDAATETTR